MSRTLCGPSGKHMINSQRRMHRLESSPTKWRHHPDGYSCESMLGQIITRRSPRSTFVYVTVESLLAIHTHEVSTWSGTARRVSHSITYARLHLQRSGRSRRLGHDIIIPNCILGVHGGPIKCNCIRNQLGNIWEPFGKYLDQLGTIW